MKNIYKCFLIYIYTFYKIYSFVNFSNIYKLSCYHTSLTAYMEAKKYGDFEGQQYLTAHVRGLILN